MMRPTLDLPLLRRLPRRGRRHRILSASFRPCAPPVRPQSRRSATQAGARPPPPARPASRSWYVAQIALTMTPAGRTALLLRSFANPGHRSGIQSHGSLAFDLSLIRPVSRAPGSASIRARGGPQLEACPGSCPVASRPPCPWHEEWGACRLAEKSVYRDEHRTDVDYVERDLLSRHGIRLPKAGRSRKPMNPGQRAARAVINERTGRIAPPRTGSAGRRLHIEQRDWKSSSGGNVRQRQLDAPPHRISTAPYLLPTTPACREPAWLRPP